MFRNHYITIAAWIIVYISLWLSRDNLVSSKFSKNNVTVKAGSGWTDMGQ